jgi:soluble lytic murein transglycosylase
MTALRSLLFLTASAAAALAQAVPAVPPGGPTRSSSDVVLAQPEANADTPAGLPGPRPTKIRVLSAADHDLFMRAFEAASRGDWVGARNLAAQGQSPVAKRLLEWRYALDKDSGASFAEIDQVIKATEANTGAGVWPLRGTLQARAEAQITQDMPANAILAWFGNKTPNSSIGKIRLGEALIATGDKARGATLIRQGWAEGSFEPTVEQDILAKDAAFLSPESDAARLDALLWRGEINAAKRQLTRVDPAAADLANARIALLSVGLPKAQALADKFRNSSDPGLLFDWSHALRMAGRDNEAHALLLHIPAGELLKNHAARWWAEVSVQARDALASADPKLALELVQHAGFTGGDQYADQQFLAGFIALRFLKDPNTALAAFQKLDAGVSRPISKSRAQYWQGRSYEALNDTTNAKAHYQQAAAYPETFYGQLALARIDPAPTLRLSNTAVEAAPTGELDAGPLMPEIKVLAELGQQSSLRLFIDRDVEAFPTPRHIKRLILSLNGWGYPEIAVRLAKGLSYAGVYLPAYTHPLITLPPYPGPGTAPDPAFVLGLIRQETEFDVSAVSSAGARGLMQLMPADAKAVAKVAHMGYRPQALTSDANYNMQLGMTEARGRLDRYGGSWVLAAASYNAGATNAKRWLASNGDPRLTDPIDWIEQIPFGETRNYVQRVLENAEVYRARLAGKDVPLRISQDLYAPNPPTMAALGTKN